MIDREFRRWTGPTVYRALQLVSWDLGAVKCHRVWCLDLSRLACSVQSTLIRSEFLSSVRYPYALQSRALGVVQLPY